MNQAHLNALVVDIRDCAKRAHEFGYYQRAVMLSQIAIDLELMPKPSASIAPVADNKATRAETSRCFKSVHELLKNIIK